MDISFWVIVGFGAAILLALGYIGYRLHRNASADRAAPIEAAFDKLKSDLIARQAEALLGMRDSIDNANRIINDRLAEGARSMDHRMSILPDIETQLGRLAVQAGNIEEVGKNIQSLSDLLKPPKLRGTVGEMLLEHVLAQILPRTAFELQYRFPNGVAVDAAIKLGDLMLPVDSKFPLEAFQRLQENPEDPVLQKQFTQVFRKHVDDIAGRYIQPDQKTTEFAVLYVPAEAIYYQLVSQEDQAGFNYALSKRIVPSSPGHLYAFLASLAGLLREANLPGSSSGEDLGRLRAGLDRLTETTERLARFHNGMEGSLRRLISNLEHARKELDKVRIEVETLQNPFESESETGSE